LLLQQDNMGQKQPAAWVHPRAGHRWWMDSGAFFSLYCAAADEIVSARIALI